MKFSSSLSSPPVQRAGRVLIAETPGGGLRDQDPAPGPRTRRLQARSAGGAAPEAPSENLNLQKSRKSTISQPPPSVPVLYGTLRYVKVR